MAESEGTRTSLPILLLTAVLGFLGIRSYTSDSPTPATRGHKALEERATSGPRDESDESSRSADRFWQPLLRFEGTKIREDLLREIEHLHTGLLDLDPELLRCLIACVPDPVASSSKYRFDGLIDAIQRAAETQDYVFDRSFYPWETPDRKSPKKAETDKGSKEPKWFDMQIAFFSQGRTDPPSHQPGVLLLRGPAKGKAAGAASACSQRFLLVFLVGETATAGLDKKAFMAALHLISRTREYRKNHLVRVLGPHFSGSQTSLELIIRAWSENENEETRRLAKQNGQADRPEQWRPEFCVITGNATSIEKDKLENCCSPAKVTFQATVVPDTDVIDALLEYLGLASRIGTERIYKDSFAVLKESNTTLGLRFSKDALPLQGQPTTDKRSGPTYFPFPLHISEVRSAYSKSAGGSSNDVQRLPSFGSQLQLPTAEETRSSDVEPSLDPAMTAVTSERLLTQMLETISHERFRYVFILATEVKDQLFLARLIREQCPESRLVFANSADLLFTHPDYSSYLRGSIVGSSYPLYFRTQNWTFPFRGDEMRLFFPGQGEQGYYNATLALLYQEETYNSLVDYSPPFPGLYPCTPANKPRVWISVIGQGGLYPLAVVPRSHVNPDLAKDYVFPATLSNQETRPKSKFAVSHPGLLILPMLGIMLLLVYVGLSYRAVIVRHDEWAQDGARERGTQMQRLFWPCSASRMRKRQQFYSFVCLTSVLVIYSYLAFIWMLPLGHRILIGEASPVDMRPWHIIMFVVLIALFVCFVAVLVLRVRRTPTQNYGMTMGQSSSGNPSRRQPSPAARRDSVRTLLHNLARHYLLLIIVFLVGWMASYIYRNGRLPRWWWDHPGECLLFAARASNLANGVTPVVPIVLIGVAFYIWGYAQLRRLYLLDQHAVDCPCPPNGDSLFQRITRCHHEITRRLRKPRLALESLGGVILWVLLFFTLSRLSSRFVPAAEGVLTEVPILMSLAILAMLIVYGWLHLSKVWQSTNRMLEALALLPLHGAFSRLPLAITNIFGHYLNSLKPRSRDIRNYQLHQREVLAAEYSRIAWGLNAVLDLSAGQRTTLESALAETDTQALSRTVQACLLVLQHVKNNPRLSEQYLSSTPEESKNSPVQPPMIRPWLDRVQEFVALEVMVYLSQYFVQMRNLAVSLSSLPLLMLIAVSSYPFQPQRLWLLLSMTLTVLVVMLVISIIVRVERNELVSRIGGTTPHQLNFHWAFFSHVLVYALPLLGVIVAWSSDLSNLVHAWVDPLIQTMR